MCDCDTVGGPIAAPALDTIGEQVVPPKSDAAARLGMTELN